MEIVEFGSDDSGLVARFVDVSNAVRRHDAPWQHLRTVHAATGMLRHGWDGEPAVPFLATHDGDDVAAGEWHVGNYDNLHIAWLTVDVHPSFRRRGHGTELLEALVDRTRAAGRTSVGGDGWDNELSRSFAARHGFEQKAVEVNRRQLLAEVDPALVDRLHAEAAAVAAAYELVRCPARTPDDELSAMAAMVSAINDAPTDDLDIEDEVFNAERVRAYEEAHVGRGITLHRLVARHRETGELAGQTVIGVDRERPHLGDQHDTSVVRAHRGHRLGLLLKTGMLQWLREVEPQIEEIDTWNAESNSFMIDVNEMLGYRIVGRALAFQKSLA
ncbi:GNAT family N-acetyltransferase [Nocardioides sp. LS1]|uniref:GNAT family N-acetyltransferase n=1 Tax=Nocardioides sp. LS1 TaxID=1027620 RepID=UPI000F61D67B|nr:GNAT family N-acetyltransferase [Nocardioides sp. LS1]GCD89244.1 GNAT family N-acetyltransferase [Nocardioides sp. LS1]